MRLSAAIDAAAPPRAVEAGRNVRTWLDPRVRTAADHLADEWPRITRPRSAWHVLLPLPIRALMDQGRACGAPGRAAGGASDRANPARPHRADLGLAASRRTPQDWWLLMARAVTRHSRDRRRQHRPRRRARRGLRAERGRVSHRVRRAPAVSVRGFADLADAIVAVAGMAEPPLRLAVGTDAIDGIRAALESRPAALEKSAQRGCLAQQH